MTANVFVLGLDELNRHSLQRLPGTDELAFHQLLSIEELQHGDEIPVADLMDKATRRLERFDGRVDAILGYWDFPVSCMLPLLCQRFGLPSTSLESRLKCEHKYWSRLEQHKVLDEQVNFDVFDPYDDDPLDGLSIGFPFWMKPVKAFSSEYAYHVTDPDTFNAAITEMRGGISRVGEPFEWFLSQVDLPREVERVGGTACLVEEPLTGHQATLEGFVLDGEVHVYGVVDSVRHPEAPTFLRYEYPSQLPARVTERMADMARRVVTQVGMERSTFNIEYFWDEATDRIGLLEVNTRHSQSHALLFEPVEGVSNHAYMIAMALGREPPHMRGGGPASCAAKWFLRRFDDGVVTRSPTPGEVAAIQEEIPGVVIDLEATEGTRLSSMHDQDAYSYRLANIFVQADSSAELADKYERCVKGLHFEFAP